ncbi:hypothetical protein HWI79_3261 [Cryptosporidium felis]|nr:hypothetical protein HWI79_3261 [Cryptosporidium felis]
MSAYGREMDHHHYNGVPSSGNSNMLTGYPILYQNNHHNHPAGDLLTLQMQLQGSQSNNENENTLAALQRNWIALQQNNGNVAGGSSGANNGMLHSSIHHPPSMTIQNDEMGYMRNLLPIGGNNSSPLHSNQSTLLDSLKFGSGLEPPSQVSQYGHHHHMAGGNIQPSILDNSILGNNVGMSGMGRNNPMSVGTSPSGRLQMSMNQNDGLGVGVDMVPNNGMLPMGCNSSISGNVMVNTSANNNIEWQGGIPIRNIPDLMTMLDLSDIPPHVQIPKYYEGIKISLGEAGREILRCYINQRGIRGKFMSSSNLQQLLRVAHQCGLWNAAVRLHLEFIGEIPMTASHAEMRKYKSLQTKRRLSKRISVLSKFGAPVVRRADGEETIEYRDGMKLSLGVDGRKLLLKRIRETRSSRENEINNLFSKYGLKYSQLRNATIHELCRMAYVCGLWEEAVKLHFQHIRKKAHENTVNQQESGSDLDSEMDINKERGDDEIISNNFLQQLHTPGMDILGVSGSNSGNITGPNNPSIGKNSVMGAMGADSVRISGGPGSNTSHHVHHHPIHQAPHIQNGMGRFGMSSVGGGSVTGSGNKSPGDPSGPNPGGLTHQNSIIGISEGSPGMHPSMVLPGGGGTGTQGAVGHSLPGDHLNYDDYRGYILDGAGTGNLDGGAGLSNLGSGSMANISGRIVRHDSRGGAGMGGNASNSMGKILGVNPNVVGTGNGGNKSVAGGVTDLGPGAIMPGMEEDGLIGMTTGALGAFVGSTPASGNGGVTGSGVSGNGVSGGISGYDGIGGVSSGSGYDDYSLLSASLRKRGKSGGAHGLAPNIGPVDGSGAAEMASPNMVAHPNTSSFVMETISGILGDEPLGGGIGDKTGYKGSGGLSSVLGNDITGICNGGETPQLSAVVVLAAAKAAEAAQNSENKSGGGKSLYEGSVDSETFTGKQQGGVDGDSGFNGSSGIPSFREGEKEVNGESLSSIERVGAGEVASYQEGYESSGLNSNQDTGAVPIDSDLLIIGPNIQSDGKSELTSNSLSISHQVEEGTKISPSSPGSGGVVSPSSVPPVSVVSMEGDDKFSFPQMLNSSTQPRKDEAGTNSSSENGGVSLVARGLTTQSTTDTSIETPGN